MFLGDCFFFVCGAPLHRADGFFPAALGILSHNPTIPLRGAQS